MSLMKRKLNFKVPLIELLFTWVISSIFYALEYFDAALITVLYFFLNRFYMMIAFGVESFEQSRDIGRIEIAVRERIDEDMLDAEKDSILSDHDYILFCPKELSGDFERELKKISMEYQILRTEMPLAAFKFESLLEQLTAKQSLNRIYRGNSDKFINSKM